MNNKVRAFVRGTSTRRKNRRTEYVVIVISLIIIIVMLITNMISSSDTNVAKAESNVINMFAEDNGSTKSKVECVVIKSRAYTEQELATVVLPISTEENEDVEGVFVEDFTEKERVEEYVQDNLEAYSNENAVEENEIYYSKKRVNSISGLSRKEITELIKPYDGLRGIEDAVYELDREGINAFFTIAVIRLESGNGLYTSGTNNYFNTTTISGEWVNYSSRSECIEAFGKLIKSHYFDKNGNWYENIDGDADSVSLEEMEIHYCPSVELNPAYNTVEWIEYMQQFRWSYRVGNIMDELYASII